MSIFSLGHEKEKVSLVIDVGNSTVTCAAVVFNGDNLPKFIYCSSLEYGMGDKADSKRLLEYLVSSIDSLISKMIKEVFNHKYWSNKNKKFADGIISFSSPWFAQKTKHLLLSNEKDFIVTESFLADVLSKEGEVFKKELSPENPDIYRIVEKNILHTKINGYELKDIIDKKTKNLEAFLCMSAMDMSLINKIEDIISRYTHIHKESLSIQTFPIVSFAVIREYFSGTGDFMTFDVSGDVTDITLVQDYVIKQTVSMPSGRNFILRQISKNFDVSMEIAESMLHMFNSNKSGDDTNQKIQELVSLVEKEWSIYLENVLTELSPSVDLPTNIYLMSNSDVSHIYTDFIKMPKTDSTSTFRKLANINVIDETVVSKFYKNESSGKPNEFIVFVSLFFKKMFN